MSKTIRRDAVLAIATRRWSIALAFLLYVAPVRRKAGLVIWIAGSIVGAILLFAALWLTATYLLIKPNAAEHLAPDSTMTEDEKLFSRIETLERLIQRIETEL